MKIALLTDTHFGARGDNVVFDNFFKQFYDNIFFPELEKRQIENIIHLGDTFDRRKYINFNSLHSCRKYFFDKIQGKYKVKMLIGNHDTFVSMIKKYGLNIKKEFEFSFCSGDHFRTF